MKFTHSIETSLLKRDKQHPIINCEKYLNNTLNNSVLLKMSILTFRFANIRMRSTINMWQNNAKNRGKSG